MINKVNCIHQATTHLRVLLLSFIVVFLAACQGEDGEPGPQGTPGTQGPAGAELTGDISGFVSLFNERRSEISDRSGVTVAIEGSSPVITTVTNAQGRFVLEDVRQGTYILSYSKTGFGVFRRQIAHAGGSAANSLSSVSLAQIPSVSVANLAISFLTASTMQINLEFTAPLETSTNVRLFMSTDPNVSDTNYLRSFSQSTGAASIGQFSASLTTPATPTSPINYITATTFSDLPSGTTIYVKAYLENASASLYADFVTGLLVYPALSAGSPFSGYQIP